MLLADGIEQITARWDTKCHACGCAIRAGQQALLHPRAPGCAIRRLRTLESRPELPERWPAIVDKSRQTPKGRAVTHIDGECGYTYRVKVTYIATSKWLAVPAFSATAALASARLQADPVFRAEKQLREALDTAAPDNVIMALEARIANARERQVRPSSYVVYQGNVAVAAA